MLQKFLGHYSRMFDKTVEQLCSIAIQKNDNSEMTSSISLINDEHTSAYAALKVIKSNIVEADSAEKCRAAIKVLDKLYEGCGQPFEEKVLEDKFLPSILREMNKENKSILILCIDKWEKCMAVSKIEKKWNSLYSEFEFDAFFNNVNHELARLEEIKSTGLNASNNSLIPNLEVPATGIGNEFESMFHQDI